MSAGFAHIIKLGTVEDSGGLRVPQYQFTYDDGSNTYARTFGEGDLFEFLRDDLALRPDLINRVRDDLRAGDAVLNDVHISQNDSAAMGLTQSASDV